MLTKTETIVKVNEKKGEVKLTTRISLDLAKSLKYMAIDKNTSVNALVVQALKEFLGKSKKI
jgi:predicted HicB family RNase H-like nuclease